jgi:hypothetical protein
MFKSKFMAKYFALIAVLGIMLGSQAFAVPPLDLTQVGSDIAGYIAAAALAGVAILAGLYGVRVIIRAFKAVK